MTACAEGKTHYSVISPEMGEIVPVTDDGQGPMEYWNEWALVLASNKREAKILAVRGEVIDGGMWDWVKEARQYDINPFSGMEAEPSVCGHGVCWGCALSCLQCEREFGDDLRS
jgi:hypothetical protein